MEIAVSYSRKLNHALYGGNDYESSDFFCSLKLEVEDETDPKPLHDQLHETCKMAVEDAVRTEIYGFQNGIPASEFKQFMYDYVAGRKIDGERYQAMSAYQKDIIQTIKRGKATQKRDDAKKEAKEDEEVYLQITRKTKYESE
jgi:hypothetical protein